MSAPTPNRQLADLLDEARYSSREAFARRVNELGNAGGVPLNLTYDKSSVTWWLKGRVPHRAARPIIAKGLSERLGRPITVADCGWPEDDPDGEVGLEYSRSLQETVEAVAQLVRSEDVNRRDFCFATAATAAAFTAAGWRWQNGAADASVARLGPVRGGGKRLAATDVEHIRKVTRDFRRMDQAYGSGDLHLLVSRYLGMVLDNHVNGGQYTEKVGRLLYAAVAELTGLAGSMAFDSDLHSLAQRYYIQALRLSRAADDSAYSGYVLVKMSNQALYIGHPQEALELAHAAQHAAGGAKAAPTLLARCHAREARVHAAYGDKAACESALSQAQRVLEGPDRADATSFGDFGEAEFAAQMAYCYRDLNRSDAAVQYARRALELHDPAHARSRALDMPLLASAYLGKGDLDAACQTGIEAVTLASQVRSARAVDNVRQFRRQLTPYRGERPVREFGERYTELLGA